jgi:hypothetical protein
MFLILPELEQTIYHTQGEHANLYTSDDITIAYKWTLPPPQKKWKQMKLFYKFLLLAVFSTKNLISILNK